MSIQNDGESNRKREPSPKELLERAISGISDQQTSGAGFSINELSEIIPGFEFLNILGIGGMGTVYEARQLELDRTVAIKLLKPSYCPLDESYTLPKDFRERFRREARAMAMMKHPNIVTVHDFGITEDRNIPYIVMEVVEGEDLAKRISDGPIKPGEVLELVQKICNALQYAHERGLIHRDIKPANVLLTEEGEPKLTDFGLSKLSIDDLETAGVTQSGEIVGTPEYMAPEQSLSSGDVDHRADVFSVGVLLYEMLTAQRLRGSWRPPSEIRPGIPQKIDAVVSQSTEAEPDDRIQSAGEVGEKVGESFAKVRKRKWLFVVAFSLLGILVAFLLISEGAENRNYTEEIYISSRSLSKGEATESANEDFKGLMERSKGILTDQFALYFQMSGKDLVENIPPRELGFRPEIVRVWPFETEVCYAGFWVKGTQDWEIGFQLEKNIVYGAHEEMQSKGWTLSDFPPGHLGREYGIWTKDHPRYASSWPGIRNADEPPWVLGPPIFHPHQRGCADFRSPTILSFYAKPRERFKERSREVRLVPLASAKSMIQSFLKKKPDAILRSVEWAHSSKDQVWIHISIPFSKPVVERRLVEGTSRKYLIKRSIELAENGWIPFDLSTGGLRQSPHFLMIWERPLTAE